MNKETAILEISGLTHTYRNGADQTFALKGVDLQLAAGQMTAIMGPSGAGKTTLLKIVGGLLAPTAGEVRFEGKSITAMSAGELAKYRRRHVGFVFQDYNLVDNLTVVENVALPLELDGMRTGAARRLARQALRSVNMDSLAFKWAWDLSGGQAQRVAVARALVTSGRIILADEPTGALDTAASEIVMELLRKRVDEGATCLLVTHEPALAAWADRIVYLRDGRFISAEDYARPGLAADSELEARDSDSAGSDSAGSDSAGFDSVGSDSVESGTQTQKPGGDNA